MPTTVKITKEMIIQAAFQIVRENGLEHLTNKEIADKLHCSIQPIYYQFKNVDDLKGELLVMIEKYFYDFILNNMSDNIPPYKQIGLNYIKFARKEKEFFKILFMSKQSLVPKEFISKDEKDFAEIARYINISTNLTDKDIEEFHIKMWIFTHGVATLVANETCKLNEEQISELLSDSFQAFMLLEENPNNKWNLKNRKKE